MWQYNTVMLNGVVFHVSPGLLFEIMSLHVLESVKHFVGWCSTAGGDAICGVQALFLSCKQINKT